MPAKRKKLKTVEELSKHIKELTLLQQITKSIYLVDSETKLLSIIKENLPPLCEMQSIELSCCKRQNSKTVYNYECCQIEENYFIHFCSSKKLSSQQKTFLKKVGRILEKALLRLEQYKELKNNKEQWELAFDTMTIPICLVDLKNRILRTNKTFRKKTKMSKASLLQKNYFATFFKRPDICKCKGLCICGCENAKRRELRHIERQKEFFEISQQMITQNKNQQLKLVILRDITEQIKMEKQIANSAQSVELGIISSSIAHELNNPIGGIMVLLQTLLVEHPKSHFTNDLNEMSLAIHRCSHIINQLLNVNRQT